MITRRNCFKIGTGFLSIFVAGAAAANDKSHENSTVPVHEYDSVIIGAGTGGLVTAIEAYDQGLKPVVLEKMDAPAGNSLYAAGGIASCASKFQEEQGFKLDKDSFREDMMKISQYRADPELVEEYVQNIGPGVDWLRNHIGVKFVKANKMPWPILDRLIKVNGEGIPGGGKLVRDLLAACKKRNIPVLYNTKAVELITNNKGRVVGVKAMTDDGVAKFMAKDGVVVATGGFSANREMLNIYMGGPLSRIALRGSPYVMGENVSLTRPLGAKFVNMDQFHSGPIVEETHINPIFVIDSGLGIDVDVRGDRFVDEVNTYVAKALAAAKKIPENKAYHIVDSHWKIADREAKRFQKLNTEMHIANSIEELAEKMGIPKEKLVKLVAEYNERFEKGTLKDMNPPCSLAEPKPLNKAPFYAFPFQGGITATFGGPKINKKAQVVNTEDKPIKGLYAVGNAAGGLFFGDYLGGSQLGGATVFGRIAAQDMAKNHK